MSKKSLAIIHFYPLEFFPPVTNLLNFFSSGLTKFNVYVFTTHNNKKRKIFQHKSVKIRRYLFPLPEENAIIRGLKYSCFFIGSLFQLILKKPDTIIYYETISSWPVYVYSKYINKKCNIFIHFHEYASQEWYLKYMKLVRYFHKLELDYLYDKAIWISQTNKSRLKIFSQDNFTINANKLKVLPNYPPKSWSINKNQEKKSDKIRLVYIGSLSFEGTFISEFCNWVSTQNNFIFDVYSYNIHDEVRSFLNQFDDGKINFYEDGVDYQEIPNLLKKYDVGIILHKAFNENYKYNATNKLFEYLICDLDVWFPNEMLGCQEFSSINTWPVVTGMDFKNLAKIKLSIYTDRKDFSYEPKHFFYEEVFIELIGLLLK